MSQDNTCALSCHQNNDGHCISWAKVSSCQRWRENNPMEDVAPDPESTESLADCVERRLRDIGMLPPLPDPWDEAAAVESLTVQPSDYAILGHQIGELVTKKQAAYGDSFGKSGDVMRILYPDGISSEKVDDALTVVRVLDKLFRIATDRDALGESPWRDVAGYALLSVARVEGI